MGPPRAPAWSAQAGAALAHAASKARMIAATTPLNLRAELGRIEPLWAAGEAEAPRFLYAQPTGFDELRGGLLRMAEALAGEGDLGALYADRARELATEAEVCAAVGGPSLWDAARQRFSRRDHFDTDADQTADAWLDEPLPVADDDDRIPTDDERDPRSLIARMRAEVGARRLALRVVLVRDLAPLAATGEGVIQIAAGRMIRARDVERTVLHEIEGHASPGERARSRSLSLFGVGTAQGSDDQEGRALAKERAAGYLDGGRRRELALRHKAARSVEDRASFIDTTRLLLARGAAVDLALRIAARVHRGGGLAREVVYIPALLRVEAALAMDPWIDLVLAEGRISIKAAPILAPWVVYNE